MRLPRFTMLQLLLAAALVALVLGLFTASWRTSTYHQINQIAFSPSGQFLAAKYAGGAVQVWRLDQNRPRLVAQAFGGPSLLGYDASSIQFVSDDKLLKMEPRFAAGNVGTIVRELTISTRAERQLAPLGGIQTYLRVQAVAGERLFYVDWPNATQLCGYNLKTQTRDRLWTLPAAVADMAASADGRTLAVTDWNGMIHIVDARSDAAPVQLAATGMQGAALSGDGSLLAVPSPAPAPALGTAVVNVYSTREPNLPDEFTTELWSADWVALSADGSRLAVLGHDAAECYDVKTKRRTGRIPVDVRPIAPSMLPTFMRGYRRGSEAALSPDGSRLATYKGGQITLYDLPSSKIAYTLTGGPRAIQIVIFTLGFAAWAAGWGIVAKRERLRQPPAAPREEARPAATRPVPTVQSPWRSIGSALIWVIMIAAFLAVFSTVGRALSLRFVLDMLLTLLGGLAAVVAIIFVYFWLARLFMGPHYFTLLRLRQVSGGVGRTFPQGDVQFWFAAPSPYEGQVGQVFDEARQRARELFGDDGPRSVPATLVAWLDRQCELDAFVGRATPVPAIVPNIWRGNSAVVCEETALRRFGHPLTALRAALALMFAIRRKRGLLPGYVGGLVSRELCWDEESPADVRAAARRLKLLLARCPDFSPQRVLLRPPNERRDLWFTLDLPESWREVRAEVDLLATLHPLLFGTTAPAGRRERVLAWLRAIKPKDDPLATMKQAVGLSLDELLAEWRAWLDSADTTYDSPSSERQAQLQTLIVRQILDRSQPALDRAKAARNLGGTSFVGAAGSLISLLSDPRCEFRGEVVDALENLSGLPLGDDLVAWQAWWTALPAELRWQTAEPPIVAELVEKAGAACALGSPSEVLAAKPNLPAPVELKVVWGLMAIGGLTALAIPITFLFVVGPLVFVTIYLSLIVGVRAMIFGAARETQGLAGVAKLQMLNIIACDPINLLLATLEQTLLRRPNVQEYLAQAGGR